MKQMTAFLSVHTHTESWNTCKISQMNSVKLICSVGKAVQKFSYKLASLWDVFVSFRHWFCAVYDGTLHTWSNNEQFPCT